MVMAGFIFISWSHKYRNGFTKTNKPTVPLDTTIKPLFIASTFTLISKLILTAPAVSTSFWSHYQRSCIHQSASFSKSRYPSGPAGVDPIPKTVESFDSNIWWSDRFGGQTLTQWGRVYRDNGALKRILGLSHSTF